MLIHPECPPETLKMTDYIGSTSGIINYAGASSCSEFIIATEDGVLYELKKQNPDKTFYMADENFRCPGMKAITLDKVLHVLQNRDHQVEVSAELRHDAMIPLEQMLKLADK